MLHIQQLFYSVAGQELFSGSSVDISGHIIGLIGDNGSGKSTLLQCISGKRIPHSGRIYHDYQRVEDFHYIVRPTGKEIGTYLFGAAHWELWEKLDRHSLTSTDYDKLDAVWEPFSAYSKHMQRMGIEHIDLYDKDLHVSGGELVRLQLCHALLYPADILLLDEPTNHLDSSGREALQDFLRLYKGQCIIATHDQQLLGLVDGILSLQSSKITYYPHNYAVYLEEITSKERSLERKIRHQEEAYRRKKKQQQQLRERLVKRQERSAKKALSGGIPKIVLGAKKDQATKSLGAIKKDHGTELVHLSKEVHHLKQQRTVKKAVILQKHLQKQKSSLLILSAENLTFTTDTSKRLFTNISFHIYQGERIAITGNNGSGKTTLLRLLLGTLPIQSGHVRGMIQNEAKTGFLGQYPLLNAFDLTASQLLQKSLPHLSDQARQTILAQFCFDRAKSNVSIRALSAGERTRLAFASIFYASPQKQLLVLDEPTNALDITSKEVIITALKNFSGALLVVSHDPWFLKQIGIERELSLS